MQWNSLRLQIASSYQAISKNKLFTQESTKQIKIFISPIRITRLKRTKKWAINNLLLATYTGLQIARNRKAIKEDYGFNKPIR